ncbi:MAG: sugar transferase [Candidatus Krumholzibacteriota bacterium]|nr:sugar transferase [Candidatus Krumholzibacteriota bacterium]
MALAKIKELNSSKRRHNESSSQNCSRLGLFQKTVKRVVDILVSIIVLIVGLPFFLAIIILIKVTSKGPGFFKQDRVGKNGRIFTFLKLRTMKVDSDNSRHKEFCRKFIENENFGVEIEGKDHKVFKIVDDPRVTGVGKFLRKTGLDELPQFINILKGEMTLVGPRPPLKYEYKYYNNWHKQRLNVKPGLTGLWQVSGRSRVSFHEMVMLDLYYIENCSLMMDLKIVLKTIPVIFTGSGGY